jgi:hypothetical protein
METLLINIKNKKDSRLIKDLLSRLDVEVKADREKFQLKLPKSKFKSAEELRAIGGTMKGRLISKEHLRSLTWKKRAS